MCSRHFVGANNVLKIDILKSEIEALFDEID